MVVDLFQAAPGDANDNLFVTSDDILAIIGAQKFIYVIARPPDPE